MSLYKNLLFSVVAALFILNCTEAFSDGRLLIRGEQYKPSYKECTKALKNGTLIHSNEKNGRVTVFYNDRGYYIAVTRAFVCLAWKYK